MEVDKERMGGATVGIEPRRISLTSVVRQVRADVVQRAAVGGVSGEAITSACADDAPIRTGTINIPATMDPDTGVLSEERRPPTPVTTTDTITDISGDVAKTLENRRVLRDIDIAVAMREHLAATNPELSTAVAFLSSVCRQPYTERKSDAKRGGIPDLPERTASKERRTATTSQATGTLGSETLPETSSYAGEVATGDVRRGRGDVESDSDHDEGEVVVLDDTEMSIGESSGDESRSRSSYSGSSYSSGHS